MAPQPLLSFGGKNISRAHTLLAGIAFSGAFLLACLFNFKAVCKNEVAGVLCLSEIGKIQKKGVDGAWFSCLQQDGRSNGFPPYPLRRCLRRHRLPKCQPQLSVSSLITIRELQNRRPHPLPSILPNRYRALFWTTFPPDLRSMACNEAGR